MKVDMDFSGAFVYNKTMTISKLIKELQKIAKQVGPRTTVVVNTREIKFGDYSHCMVNEIEAEWISWAVDDDTCLKDGTERTKLVITLK